MKRRASKNKEYTRIRALWAYANTLLSAKPVATDLPLVTSCLKSLRDILRICTQRQAVVTNGIIQELNLIQLELLPPPRDLVK